MFSFTGLPICSEQSMRSRDHRWVFPFTFGCVLADSSVLASLSLSLPPHIWLILVLLSLFLLTLSFESLWFFSQLFSSDDDISFFQRKSSPPFGSVVALWSGRASNFFTPIQTDSISRAYPVKLDVLVDVTEVDLAATSRAGGVMFILNRRGFRRRI